MCCNQFSGDYTEEVEGYVSAEWSEPTGQSHPAPMLHGLLYTGVTKYAIGENCESLAYDSQWKKSLCWDVEVSFLVAVCLSMFMQKHNGISC